MRRVLLFITLFFLSALILAVVPVSAPVQAQDELPYNLTPGKPYDGTELTFLLCCPDTPQFIAWQEYAVEFTELTGIRINFQIEPWSALQERIVVESVAMPGSYDVAIWLDSWGPTFQHTLLPLNDYIERDGIDYIDDYPSVFLNTVTFDNNIIGLPVRAHAFILYYRQDVFDQLGLEVPTTWSELLEAGRVVVQHTELEMAGIANYYGVSSTQNLFVWSLMLWGTGGDFFDDSFHPIFNNEAGVAATETYISLAEIGTKAQFIDDEWGGSTAFVRGRAAMYISWWWYMGRFQNPSAAGENVLGNVAVARVPAMDGADPVGFALTMPIGISAASRNQDAAWEWLKFLSSPEIAKRIVVEKDDKSTVSVVTPLISVMLDPEVIEANDGLQATAVPSLLSARVMPLIPEWAEVSSILEVAINEIARGADTQETLNKAAADVEAVMQRSGYYDG